MTELVPPTAPPYLRIDEHAQVDHIRLSLVGELDLLSASRLEERLDELAAQARDVRLDLSRLEFIDSTGVRVLLRALLRADGAGWRLQIGPNITDTVRRVFDLINLDLHLVGESAERDPRRAGRTTTAGAPICPD